MFNAERIKIAIADDHQIFRDGIKMALSDKLNLKILWEAENGRDIMDKIPEKPDVLLMDIRMPEMDGINAIEMIRNQYEDIKIIIISTHNEEKMINRMLDLGANAFLTKSSEPEEIYDAIISCVKNDFYFNSMFSKAVMDLLIHKKKFRNHYGNAKPVTFSEKEMKILQLLAEDKNTEEISKIIFLSPRTIETLRQNMKNKVSAKTIAGLVMYGLRNKLIH